MTGQAERTDRWLAWTAGASILATVAVATVPFLRFAYENVSLHVALETSEGLIGGLLAYLAVGRFRLSRHVSDLVLGWSFGILAATNLLLATVPNIVVQERAVGLSTWGAAGLRVVAAAGVAFAALLGHRPAWARSRHRVTTLAIGAIVGVALLAVAADVWLGEPIDRSIDASESNKPTLIGHPVLLVVQIVAIAVYARAALWFRTLAHAGDELQQWLAVGCVLAAFSRVHYLLFASLYTSWVSTGDVLRLASYLAFLVGAVREIGAYWRAQSELGASQERGRIARDLHDGLAQELSFIRSQTVGRATIDGPTASSLSDAAGRALLESRRLIRVLGDTAIVDVGDALREAVTFVAERAGATVEVEISGPAADSLPPVLITTLARVAREATGNAVRHGGATRIHVALHAAHGGGSLRVEDDGTGFDTTAPTEGFGLDAMRGRAREIGGDVEIHSAPGEGAVVILRW